jgi:hypothetical protein
MKSSCENTKQLWTAEKGSYSILEEMLNGLRPNLKMAVKRNISNILYQSAEVYETESGTAS